MRPPRTRQPGRTSAWPEAAASASACTRSRPARCGPAAARQRRRWSWPASGPPWPRGSRRAGRGRRTDCAPPRRPFRRSGDQRVEPAAAL